MTFMIGGAWKSHDRWLTSRNSHTGSRHARPPLQGEGRRASDACDWTGRGREGLRGLEEIRPFAPIPLPTSPLKGEEFSWQQGPLIGIPGCFFLGIT